MPNSAKQYTKEEEAAMRARGLVPKTIWAFDVDAPGFREMCEQESRLLAEADAIDPTIDSFSEAALRDLAEELDRLEK
jgi:hypothetical protein